MRKFAVTALLLCLLTALALPAAATAYTLGEMQYTIQNNSVTIVGCDPLGENVTVPESLEGYPVNAVAEGAFQDSRIRIVYLPDCVTEVESGAFRAGITVIFGYNTTSGGFRFVPTKHTEIQENPDSTKRIITTDSDGTQTITYVDAEGNLFEAVVLDPNREEVEIDFDGFETTSTEEPKDESFPLAVPIGLAVAAGLSGVGVMAASKRKKTRKRRENPYRKSE